MRRVHILTEGFVSPNGRAFLFPILTNDRRLRELGLDVRLFTAVSRQGVAFLWPVRLPDPETGRGNSWHESALDAAERAKTSWIRLASNRSLGAYEIFEAAANLGDPTWPEAPFPELLKIGFRDRIVDREDHPLIARLRGLA